MESKIPCIQNGNEQRENEKKKKKKERKTESQFKDQFSHLLLKCVYLFRRLDVVDSLTISLYKRAFCTWSLHQLHQQQCNCRLNDRIKRVQTSNGAASRKNNRKETRRTKWDWRIKKKENIQPHTRLLACTEWKAKDKKKPKNEL